MKYDLKSKLTRFGEDRTGAVAATAAMWLALVGVALLGLGIDAANLYLVRDALQASSDRAAVAAATQLGSSQATAISTGEKYSSETSSPTGLNSIYGVASVSTTVTPSCVWSLLPGNPTSATTCPGTGANVVKVVQTATVNTFFGFGSRTVYATAAAATNGGGSGLIGPLDVVVILDTTSSMNDCENGSTTCTFHTFSTPISCPTPATPTWFSSTNKMQAAEFAAQTLLCSFQPASGSAGTQVALMVFPAVLNSTVATTDYCGTASMSTGSSCTGSSNTVVPYSCTPGYANPSSSATYLMVPFSSDYKTSSTATALNTSSNLVKALGGSSSCRGLQAPAGEGTYFTDVIADAQAYLTKSGRSNAQKVIFLLSDGGANNTSTSATQTTNECQNAVTNADTAATAGTWVFSIAYNSTTTTGGCAYDTGTYKNDPCKTMQNIAASPGLKPDSSKFFAFNGTGSGANCTSTNVSLPTLAQTFAAAVQNLTPARLINPSCLTSETCNMWSSGS